MLTGETGGGKSIIIDSLSLLCGGRGDRALIRTGEETAFVEGIFELPPDTHGFEDGYIGEDGLFAVSRKITSDGRSICKAGGRTIPVSRLRELTSRLLNIHGQQDTQALSDPLTHLDMLDVYAKSRGESSLDEYTKVYSDYSRQKLKTQKLEKSAEDSELRAETLDFQIQELENLSVSRGEEDRLISEKTLLTNYEKIFGGVKTAKDALVGGEGVYFGLNRAIESLGRISGLLKTTPELISRLDSCLIEVKDIADSLGSIVGIDCPSPETRIDEIETRLSAISRFCRKHKSTADGLADVLALLKEERETIGTADELLSAAKAELELLIKNLTAAGEKLTSSRKGAAALLEREIEASLCELDMPAVTFVTSIEKKPFGAGGGDSVEFLVSANAGEDPKPIAKIASGGELSRIMLSIKSAFAEIDGVKTVVFDEIDSGISGKTSEKLGLKLKELSKKGIQILCVTHAVQIACQADGHLLVSKAEEGGRTFTSAKTLSFEERVDEIARIMGGVEVTGSVKAASREYLLRAAGRETAKK